MEKSLRLRKNIEFQKVYKRGKSFWNREYTILILKNNLTTSRIGFTVSKKFGSAVERNAIKRKLREIIRINRDTLVKGYDIVIIPKKNTKDMKYYELERSLHHVFGLINRKSKNRRAKN